MNKLLLVLGALLIVVTPVLALDVNDTESTNVTVTVATKVMIDINPASFTWTGVDPGSVGGPSQEANNYPAIQIENIGSRNITHIWFNNTWSNGREFATGTNASIDSGNFVVLAREGETDFWFAARKEWNESRSLVYLRDPSGNLPPSSNYYYGRFHNTSYEYFWMTAKTGYCNTTGHTFLIGNTPHTETQTGTTDFSGTYITSVTLTNAGGDDKDWGYAAITSGPLNGYCIAVYYTCDQVLFYKWNKDAPGGESCSNAQYFWSASGTPGYPLVPGNSTVAEIRVFVPYGIHEGKLKIGQLTVIVNDVA